MVRLCAVQGKKKHTNNVDSIDDIWPFMNAKVGRGMAQLDILVLQPMAITLLLPRYISFCELCEGLVLMKNK